MKTIFARLAVSLSQPSAWRGAFYVATAIGLSVRPDIQEAIVAAGLAAAGLIGIFFADPAAPAAE